MEKQNIVLFERSRPSLSSILALLYPRIGCPVAIGACNLTGYSVAELLQMNFNDLHHDFDVFAVGSFLKRILSGEKIFLDAT